MFAENIRRLIVGLTIRFPLRQTAERKSSAGSAVKVSG
jgi:hypothetical protein